MNIKKRLLPAAIIVVVTFGCILLSRPTRVLFFMALAVASAFEMQHVLQEAKIPAEKWIMIVYVICHGVLCYMNVPAAWLIAFYALAAFAVLFRAVLRPHLGGHFAVANGFIILWPAGFYAIVIHAAASDAWLRVLATAILGAWACDSMALIGGKTFGKHKLAPMVSPNKTWEGAIVGGVSAFIAGLLISLVLHKSAPIPVLTCALICFVASSFGQIGDLVASSIKRMAGVKDYGKLMPEHGGIMDKMDSMLFAIPAAYMCLYIAGLV